MKEKIEGWVIVVMELGRKIGIRVGMGFEIEIDSCFGVVIDFDFVVFDFAVAIFHCMINFYYYNQFFDDKEWL